MVVVEYGCDYFVQNNEQLRRILKVLHDANFVNIGSDRAFARGQSALKYINTIYYNIVDS